MHRVSLQAAYVLHSRPYRESSYIVDLITEADGKASAVLKGGGRRKGVPGTLQPFTELEVELGGRGELKSLIRYETTNIRYPLAGAALYAGLYLNELLVKLLQPLEGCRKVFDAYKSSLTFLSLPQPNLEPGIRELEFALLNELGFGVDFCVESATGDIVKNNIAYYFSLTEGVSRTPEPCSVVIEGHHLIAIAGRDWSVPGSLSAAKRLTRRCLDELLGGRPLHSRELMRSYLKLTKG
ncbi:DNA repair protein RecO [Hahella chejuensis KCTC 2396]|uniref:DNA repair protein RecO n=1 Tax=Hahella chejuensis (strain KCTC 2396) TaxID=349521 RepID=RECO_HAHCH|nr:DNA repair protein RecO [Hahella chejuensis]Q2SL30.1 RecName: Full=DNA repair protein RecO; AltName: Full=Recombination protein O [Hahella chejuensis KCTC 2396]ABC28644.1 DNA repair protein RecO [Hahella chejuensis KCTC 2396]